LREERTMGDGAAIPVGLSLAKQTFFLKQEK
jgi:hypothetical protein